MENDNTKISFWKKLIFSIKSFEKYEVFLKERKRESTSYLIKLIAILSLVSAICIAYMFKKDSDKVKAYFNENISQISFNKDSNILTVNNNEELEIYSYELLDGKIIVNTSDNAQVEEYRNDLKQYTNGIIVLKDRIMLISNGLASDITYEYSEIANAYSIENFEKEDIQNIMNGSSMYKMYLSVVLVMFVVMFISYLISVFITIFLLMILGYLTSKMFKIDLDRNGNI